MAKTVSVTKQGNGKWLAVCSKCPAKRGFTNWTAASSWGWRHVCPSK